MGVDFNTNFQRSFVCATTTEEKTCLLKHNETKEFIFNEIPLNKEGYTNYHLHICFPDRDSHIGRENNCSEGQWSISPENEAVIFDPKIHSILNNRVLASTQMLMGNNPDWDDTDFTKYPEFDRTKSKDVYNICNSLIEAFANTNGKLEYVMVQPFYSSHGSGVSQSITHVKYKKDINNFIAVFPAIAYNYAGLKSQVY
jgi:hypothetical protein